MENLQAGNLQTGYLPTGTRPASSPLLPSLRSEKIVLIRGTGPEGDSESADSDHKTGALEDPERLRELQESLGRLEEFAAQAQAENTIRAYAADLKDFRHWCKKIRTGVAAGRP